MIRLGDKKQLIRIISKITKFVINIFGYIFKCIILVLARIIITVTQIVRAESVNDIISEDMYSVNIE